MNNETRAFLTNLLLKYNSYRKFDPEQIFFDNAKLFGYIGDQAIELKANDALSVIDELCLALDMFELEGEEFNEV